MAVRAVTEDEMLGGPDDDTPVSQETQDSLNDLDLPDDEGGEVLGVDKGKPREDGAGSDEDVLVILNDEDDDKKEEVEEEREEIIAKGERDLDDDSGELVDEKIADLTPWEKKNLPKVMQQRLAREKRLRRDAEGAQATQIAAAQEAEKRAYQAELKAYKMEKAAVTLYGESLKTAVASKTTELVAAKEAGDTNLEVKTQGELDDLRAQVRDNTARMADLDKQPEPVAPKQGNPLGAAWAGRNPWFSNPKYAAEAAALRAIDQEMQRGGMVANSADYFHELDRRFHKKMPNARNDFGADGIAPSDRVKPGDRKPAPKPRVMGVQRSSGIKPSNPNRVSLTADDIANMKRFNLDTDPTTEKGRAELKAYARQKQRREAGHDGTV